MTMSGNLGILVQSGNYFEFVENLADAAEKRGKQLKIHLLGTGVTLVSYNGFTHLTQLAPVTICTASFEKQFGNQKQSAPQEVTFVKPEHITEIIQWCDRCVVF